MEDQAKQMHEQLSEILARFHHQATLIEKLGQDMKQLGQQVEITQEAIDEVKKQQSEWNLVPHPPQPPLLPPPRPSASHTSILAEADLVPTMTTSSMLTNHQPPLLAPPPAPNHTPLVMAAATPVMDKERYFRPPRHYFCKFQGENPLLWLDRCCTYFEMYRVPMTQWVSTVTLYIEGHAALWLQAFKRHHVLMGWELFGQAVEEEFGLEEYDAQMNRLLLLKQTGTVAEYRVTFELCMYHLLALDSTLHSKFFVTQFLIGLRDDIRAAIRLQAPTSVTRAAVLAPFKKRRLRYPGLDLELAQWRSCIIHRYIHLRRPQTRQGDQRAQNAQWLMICGVSVN